LNTEVKPAATIVVVRERNNTIQVLLLRRNPKVVFAGDNWVFPGGKVEAIELEQAGDDIDVAYRLAAIRECKEETGILMHPEQLVPVSHWTTPKSQKKRFATQFYMGLLTQDVSVEVDQSEIIDHVWLTPQDALEQQAAGQLEMMPPTFVTLASISKHQNYNDILSYVQEFGTQAYKPRIKVRSPGNATFLYQGDSGYSNCDPSLKEQLNRCEMTEWKIEHLFNLNDH